jgi:ABC-type multidrug transport system fused ATPase/permease subunit
LSEQTSQGQGFVRLLGFTRPHIGKLAEAISCMVIISFIMLAIPWGFKIIIDQGIPDQDLWLMTWVLVAILLLHAFRMVLYYVGRYLVVYVGQRVIFELRQRLFGHVQRLSMRFYDERGTGEIVSRVMSDVGTLQGLLEMGLVGLVTSLLTLTVVLAALFLMNWRMTLVALAVLPLLGLIVAFFRNRLKQASRSVRENVARMYEKLMEVIPGVKVVKAFAAEYREKKKFDRILERGVDLNITRGVLGIHYMIWSQYVVAAGTAFVLWFGGRLVISGAMSLGELVAFYALVNMLYTPVRDLAMIMQQVMPARAATERIFEILDLQPDITDQPDSIVVTELHGDVEFENVSFSYQEKSPVLKNVTFKVQAGQRVALVGRSGCGKTTITNLLLRLYDPDEGRILVDGTNIQRIRIRSYRKKLGLVMQESVLLGGTIEDNIYYGNPNASPEDVLKAAEAANVLEFTNELPNRLKTPVGEFGTRLSAGEKQRVAIARALLIDPSILILDEMTSALDTITEMKVQQALDRLTENRTVFVIAHRLSTIHGADVIIALKRGRIVQMGPPEELMKQPGLFRQLLEAGPESWKLPELVENGASRSKTA